MSNWCSSFYTQFKWFNMGMYWYQMCVCAKPECCKHASMLWVYELRLCQKTSYNIWWGFTCFFVLFLSRPYFSLDAKLLIPLCFHPTCTTFFCYLTYVVLAGFIPKWTSPNGLNATCTDQQESTDVGRNKWLYKKIHDIVQCIRWLKIRFLQVLYTYYTAI